MQVRVLQKLLAYRLAGPCLEQNIIWHYNGSLATTVGFPLRIVSYKLAGKIVSALTLPSLMTSWTITSPVDVSMRFAL